MLKPIEVVFEKGVFKPLEPVDLKEEGTIEKSSDFLIYHPSYPTFSSCLQIVNYHKVIPH